MSQEPAAIAVAKAHVEAWSNHDWDKPRSALAADVKVKATTPDAAARASDLTGADPYLEGLIQFAGGLERGSTRVIASMGDERNLLLTVTSRLAAGGPFGTGTLSGAGRYLLDEGGKIKVEQGVFYVAPD
jgi:hypothetical protein